MHGIEPCNILFSPIRALSRILADLDGWYGLNALRVLLTVNCRWWNASAYLGVMQALALKRVGIETLLQVSPGTPAGEMASRCGVPTAAVSLSSPVGLAGFVRMLARFDPRVICCHRGPGHLASALLGGSRRLVRIRSDIRKPRRGIRGSILMRRTDLVVVPSPWMLRDRDGYVPREEGRSALVPAAVDTEHFRFVDRSGTGESAPVLLALGRLSPVKGYGTLLRAAAGLGSDVTVIIAGREAQYDSDDIRSYASGAGYRGALELPGRVDDIRPLLERATLGVVTSLGSEVISRACLEMMSSGLPVLAAATNGLVDLVRDGETGLIHPPGDWSTLSRQAGWLLENPEVALGMGRRARSLCERDHSLAAVGEKWVSVLGELVL